MKTIALVVAVTVGAFFMARMTLDFIDLMVQKIKEENEGE